MDLQKTLLLTGAFLVLYLVFRRFSALRHRRGHVRVGRDGGAAVLRLPPGHHLMLGSLVLLPAGVLAVIGGAALRAGAVGPGGMVALGLAGLACLAALGWFVAAELRRRIRVDPWGIEEQGVWRRRRMAWADLAKLTYNPHSAWFFVQAKDGTRCWVPESWHGLGDFAELALAHLPPALLAADPDTAEALRDLAAQKSG